MIIARKSCDSKFFPVCGHLCGQSRFSVRLADPVKSRKRPCCKGFWASAVLVMDEKTYAPKCGALPTGLHPDIQFLLLYHSVGENHSNFLSVVIYVLKTLPAPSHRCCHPYWPHWSALHLFILPICKVKSRHF